MEEKIERKRIQVMKENDNKRRKLWILLARKEIPKVVQLCIFCSKFLYYISSIISTYFYYFQDLF